MILYPVDTPPTRSTSMAEGIMLGTATHATDGFYMYAIGSDECAMALYETTRAVRHEVNMLQGAIGNMQAEPSKRHSLELRAALMRFENEVGKLSRLASSSEYALNQLLPTEEQPKKKR